MQADESQTPALGHCEIQDNVAIYFQFLSNI